MKDRKIRVLSIDGGGIRGLLSAQLLFHIEELIKIKTKDKTARIGDYFDIISGTSTGAILTCAYLTPDEINRPLYSAKEIVDFYLVDGKNIFYKKWYRKLQTVFGLFGAEFTDKGFKKVLEKYFGNNELKDLIKPCLIPALDTENKECVFFKQHYAIKDETENYLVKDIVRATTAAPTYFTPARISSKTGNELTLVDGGLYANNPAICTYTEINKIFKSKRYLTVRDVKILSIGTGQSDNSYMYDDIKRWNNFKWIKAVFDLTSNTSNKVDNYNLDKLFDSFNCTEQYLRINPFINKDMIGIDDVSDENLTKLKDKGTETYDKYFEEISKFLDI